MNDLADRLIADAEARFDGAFGEAAGLMASKLFEILGEQADVTAVGGRIYATVRATPGTPPRRVTGNLQAHVGLDHLGPGHWVFGIRAGVPYAHPLEFEMNHRFFGVVMEENADEMNAVVADRLGRG